MEYFTSEVNQLQTQIKGLNKKIKNAPDDLQAQLKTFLREADEEMEALHGLMEVTESLNQQMANYFCEDGKKFKLEQCLSEINGFLAEFETAVKVGGIQCICTQYVV